MTAKPITHYAGRNPCALEPHYTAHVLAMTQEDLYEKSDIAAELAWRDQQIDALRAQVEALTKALAECRDAFPMPDPGDELESIWGQAMGDPESVPGYVKDQVTWMKAERRVVGARVDAAAEAMSLAMISFDLGNQSLNFERALSGLRSAQAFVPTPSPLTRPAVPWREAVLDLIDECPGLSMEQDHWLSRRVKELDFPSATAPRLPTEDHGILYLLRRLLSNQHTFTGPEFRAELTKIIGEVVAAAPQPEATIKESSRVEAQPTEAAQPYELKDTPQAFREAEMKGKP